jgi:hypothetical protein
MARNVNPSESPTAKATGRAIDLERAFDFRNLVHAPARSRTWIYRLGGGSVGDQMTGIIAVAMDSRLLTPHRM